VKKSVLLGLAVLAGLSLLSVGCRKNPADNTREPEPYTDKPVENHHFDGGASDPYGKDTGENGEGEGKSSEGGAPPGKSGE
jgi:hypothetical protein